ncbi:hypothetical protein EW146_g2200 [Bondarzewia mesenterica]|uniref:Uncharacterized protein n=1 Tax=Bondarzewia mesenterica TaxID=1095465 RepID=A0A4S4M3M8_9AGAM|nr:hypothetical protein EW146_g2200 [Bondarzewia mesenterica]
MAGLPGSILSISFLNSPSSSSTATSSVSSSTSLAFPFYFNTVAEMWTCGEATVTWNYLGSASGLKLGITNDGVMQKAAPTHSLSDGTSSSTSTASASGLVRRQTSSTSVPTINQTLVTQLDPFAYNWTWSKVDVPQGWYVMEAFMGSSSAQSTSFFVNNGTDVSCLIGSTPSSSSSSPASATSASSAASSSSSAIVAPVSGSSRSSHAGAIAGGVVGGVAFVSALLAALLFWFCRRRPSRARARALGTETGIGGSNAKWSGLATITLGSVKKARHTSDSADALSKNAHDPPPSAVPSQLGHTPTGSDEQLHSFAEEKVVVPSNVAPAAMPFVLPPTKRASSSSSVANVGNQYRSRSSSQRALSSPDPPRSGHHNTPSIESIAHTRLGRPVSYAVGHGSSPAEMIPLERAGTTAARRAVRKPVPRYDSSDFAEPSSPPPAKIAYGTPESGFEGGQSSGSVRGHGSSSSSSSTVESMPKLHHQPSFGHMRPMRVMMPDMPPPCAD